MSEQKNPIKDKPYSQFKWLKRIQEQSWEPEILISGIVLFALIQLPPVIREFFDYLDNFSFPVFSMGTADETLFAVLLTANYWLIAGFTAHLILRSVWIAFVGLSYVYKDGVDLDRLKYKPAFKKVLEKNTDYVRNILKLEKICSSVFAVSFLIFMVTLGAFFSLSVLVIIFEIGLELAPDWVRKYDEWVDPIVTLITLILVIDFVGLGVIKRIPILSRLYYPFYRLMSVLTLSPLYRNIYYGFISNHKKWKVGLAMTVFIVLSFLITISIRFDQNPLNSMTLKIESSDKELLYHGHYENLMGNDPSKRIHIPADVIDGTVLPVFVVLNAGLEERYILDECDYEQLQRKEGINRDSLRMACLSNFYGLKIDGEWVESSFLYHIHQRARQEGLMSYLDISNLSRGMHQLELIYRKLDDEDQLSAVVEFYKTERVSRPMSVYESTDSIQEFLPRQDSALKQVPN